MIASYLTIAFRSLARHKAYTAINLFGLTIGLASCLVILIFVRQELSYDSWLPDADRVYQVESQLVAPDEPPAFQQTTFYPVAAGLKKDYPEVEQSAGTWRTRPVVLRGAEPTFADLLLADPTLFDILQLPFAAGDRAIALREADSLVLSEEAAQKYFGRSDALGRTLTILRQGKKYDLRVTGVLKKLPPNTHLDFSLVARISPSFFPDNPMALDGWNNIPGYVYVKLRPGADVRRINASLHAWEKRTIPTETLGKGQMSRADRWALHLENVRNIHTGRFQEAAMTPGTDRTTIVTFAMIGLLILGIACANFTNLATARAGQRAREVALRKLVGAKRRNLVAQFLIESTLLAAIALLLALALAEVLLPPVAAFLHRDLHLHYFGRDGAFLPMVALTVLLGLLAGLYPAFYLSRFRPAEVLRSNKSGDTPGSGRIRTALVVAQFAVSIALFICTAIVYAQTKHAESADIGYDRNGLLVVRNIGSKSVLPAVETLKREIGRLPGVVSVARSSISPGSDRVSKETIELPGRVSTIVMESYDVDSDFFRTMGMKLEAGRTFSEKFALDESSKAFSGEDAAVTERGANVIVSRSAARQLGFGAPQSAIGRHMNIGGVPAEVVGVVGDVQLGSLRSETRPIIYRMSAGGQGLMLIRFAHAHPSDVIAAVSRLWRQHVADMPFDAVFAQDEVEKLYESDTARSEAFAVSSLLAIVIGCLGLYGLAAFTAERRTKEIGIRKVLGARTRDIVRLLVWQFNRPVLLSNLVAWPVAWWLMRGWLNEFSDRISLHPGWFVGGGSLALAIATTTIIGHAVRVARMNPVYALRYE